VREGYWVAAGLAGAVLLTVATVLTLNAQAPADGSVLSRSSGGWLAARIYLEKRGSPVKMLDEPLDAPFVRQLLVLVFPFQRFSIDNDTVIDRHLQGGGDVLFAYSGRRFDVSEGNTAEALDLGWDEPKEAIPLNPLRWRRYVGQEWSLLPEPKGDLARVVRLSVLQRLPRPRREAVVWLRSPTGVPAAFLFHRLRGRVAVVPAEALSNARLREPGNADLLEALRAEFTGTWVFDEFHHGLSAPATIEAGSGPQHVLLAYLGQIVFVYVLAVLAVVRRFGPAWSEGVVTSGSAATFLVGLGALHHRLGHHQEASRLLLARARELDSRLALPREGADDPALFLRLAQRVGEVQSRRGKTA